MHSAPPDWLHTLIGFTTRRCVHFVEHVWYLRWMRRVVGTRLGKEWYEEYTPTSDHAYVCMVTHIVAVWINRVWLPILLVASWTGKINVSLFAFAPENLASRDGFGSLVLRQPAHLHAQAESGAYLRDSSRVPRRRPYIYLKPPYAIRSVTSLSGHAIAYRWRSLPRVRRHRVSKPQGSSKRVLPWQATVDQLICASHSHTHYWYEVGMLKVPALYRWLVTRVCALPSSKNCWWWCPPLNDDDPFHYSDRTGASSLVCVCLSYVLSGKSRSTLL